MEWLFFGIYWKIKIRYNENKKYISSKWLLFSKMTPGSSRFRTIIVMSGLRFMEKIKGGLSAGWVQLFLVLLIVGRERDTQNFNAVRGKLYLP
jgi:hypothetical protein